MIWQETWRRTFSLDLMRSIPMGVTETVSSTFAMFIAVGMLDLGTLSKSMIIAGPACGMILSLFSVAFVRRIGLSANVAAALGWIVASLGYAVVAMSEGGTLGFVAGVVLALTTHTLAAPLQAQIYREHYADNIRGRLFSFMGTLRALVAAIFGFYAGRWLMQSQGSYAELFWMFSVASVLKALCTLGMERVYLRKSNKLSLLDSFGHLKVDPVFRKLIISWMVLGFGNLLCMALFVEYITNPEYGFGFGAEKVSLVTTSIPMLVFIVSAIAWGAVYDKMEFYRLRVLTNLFFFAGLLVYFLVPSFWGLCLGMCLHGIGKSGGNVLWSLWTTKFAPADKVSEYMSVHTFFTGVRGIVSAFLAFELARWAGPSTVAIIGATCIAIASLMLLPEVRANWKR